MLVEKISLFIERYDEIGKLLLKQEIVSNIDELKKLSKEQKDLESIVETARKYISTLDEIKENRFLLEDDELAPLAKEELKNLEPQVSEFENQLKILLIPKDPNDEKNVFLEIRAGTGGDESAIFVGDMFGSYVRYAENRGWKIELMSSSEGTSGGHKEIIAKVSGVRVYGRLKYEGGTHRVQRVPNTESQGRIHTSAVTIAVMPEVDDVEVDIKQNEIKIDVYRSSGCGGQSVNTTDSAVRITHLPTGIVVSIQDEKSQHKNRDKAMKILKARVYEQQLKQMQSELGDDRKSQVGSGDRSERIRTYNYPQNRITDHRINLTLYRLEAIMGGGLLDEIVDPLIADNQASNLDSKIS
jgi:peptide chain release factor 1